MGDRWLRRFRPPPGWLPLRAERVARALPSAGIEGGWSAKRPYSARGRRDFGRTQGASKPAVPAGQLPEGARVIMPPGPCVPFPGAWGTFPQTRRPAARSPSEAAVATRTPSGASARTIGIVGIKCQECSAEPPSGLPALARRPSSGLRATFSRKREKGRARPHPSPMRSMGEGARRAGEGPSDSEGGGHRCWRTGPHPALRATFSRKREKGPASNHPFSRKREKDDGRSSLRASAGTDDDGIATCTDYFRYFFVWYVSASSMTSTMRSTCWRVRTRGGEMMKVS